MPRDNNVGPLEGTTVWRIRHYLDVATTLVFLPRGISKSYNGRMNLKPKGGYIYENY